MIKFDKEKVLLLHQLIIQESGGDKNLRDIELLDAALESAYATFDSKELFPTKEEKAARLGFGLISNHAFVDGNKRIGMCVLLTFLAMTGVHIEVTDGDIVHAGMSVADGSMHYEDLLKWITDHKTNN